MVIFSSVSARADIGTLMLQKLDEIRGYHAVRSAILDRLAQRYLDATDDVPGWAKLTHDLYPRSERLRAIYEEGAFDYFDSVSELLTRSYFMEGAAEGITAYILAWNWKRSAIHWKSLMTAKYIGVAIRHRDGVLDCVVYTAGDE